MKINDKTFGQNTLISKSSFVASRKLGRRQLLKTMVVVGGGMITTTLQPMLTTSNISASAPKIYDLTDDWSDINNPNNTWRLYKAPTQLFTTNILDHFGNGTNQKAWAEQPIPLLKQVPAWLKTTGNDLGFVDPGTVVVHGAESWRTGTEFTSVGWVCPDADDKETILISGGVWVDKAFDRPMTWELRKNGISLTHGLLTQSDPYTKSNPFDFVNGSGGASVLQQPVVKNDEIELIIYRQTAASAATWVGVKLRITVLLSLYLPIILTQY